MASTHRVAQGEHISGIAFQYGFSHYSKIWDHPNNADLKALRKNPHILFPDDEVYIPDRESRTEQCATEKLHVFKEKIDHLSLNVELERVYDDAIANAPCDLLIDPSDFSLTTDGAGDAGHEIAPLAVKGTLTVKETLKAKGQDLPISREIELRIGYLDPAEEVTGQRARLANLGYYRSAPDSVDDAEFLSATEEFQCEHGLTVDGVCGPQTQATLVKVHGC